MIQYYSVTQKHCLTRKATVETILKQLEYVTKGLIAMQATLF